MSPRGRQFLFVNKDSSSDTLSRSQASERRTILSHVQNKRRTKEAATHAEPWTEEVALVTVPKHAHRASRDESIIQQQMEYARKSMHFSRARSSPARLPLMYPTNNASDPFHATAVGANVGNHAMLNFTYVQSRSIFLTEAYAPLHIVSRRRTMRHSVTLEERLRRCVEDDMLMNSTLAYGTCSQGWALGKIDSDRPPEYFIGEAIKTLRHTLSQPDFEVDTWLLLSVYSLAVTGFWNSIPLMWTKNPERYAHAQRTDGDRLTTARMHMNAFLQLVEKAGGWQCVDPYVLESAVLAEMYMSITLMTPPVIPVTWDPGYLPPSAIPHEEYRIFPRLGTAFRELEAYLVPELANEIQHVIAYLRMATALWSSTTTEVTHQDESWLFLRLRAIMFRLLSMRPGRYDDCIRLTTLVFLCSSIPNHGAQIAARSLIAHLKPALEKTLVEDGIMDVRTRIWCLCTGAMTSEYSAERDWYTSMAAEYVVDRINEEELQEILEEHLFLPSAQEADFADMMRRMSRRGISEPELLGA